MFGQTDFTLFGVSWILCGAIAVALVRRYWATVPEEGVKVGAALWMVAGYLVNALYVAEEWIIPQAPEAWIGLILGAFIYFGSVMGLAPGDTAGKVKRRIVGR
jgi:hypothetical protein